MPNGSVSASKSNSRNRIRNRQSNIAYMTVQIALGALFFGIWVLVGTQMQAEPAAQSIITATPYFIFYFLGALSRHVPGVGRIAKRLRSAMPQD
jgi:hypothetical protein